VIVTEDADWRAAVAPLSESGSFYHAGQVCVSAQRIYVHESIALEFAQAFAEVAKKQIIGDPTL
jgi:acyl-CoA reductase-like NAD-dependent aldehyde dehydrogenase